MKGNLFRTKAELKKALAKDLSDRKKMKKDGFSTKGITQVINQKRRILKSKTYWK